MQENGFTTDVVVVGGAGHVGLPLAIAFASRGLRVHIFDVDEVAVGLIRSGELPFRESRAQGPLVEALRSNTLTASTDPASVSDAEHVVVVVGTPVDEHLNPDPSAVPRAVQHLLTHLRRGQLLVLRSTVFPGVTARTEAVLEASGLRLDVAFCPERIAEGKALEELASLPQLVSARSPEACQRASSLFGKVAPSTVELAPEEAELAKLFGNAWRYLKFAVANQFFMMANDAGLDYETIRSAVAFDYPRAADLPRAGFAAGPCLVKDTLQLGAFARAGFPLGEGARLVNEGLPQYLVSRLEAAYDLGSMRVGILGMAFKAGSDDTRSSLSYKLKRLMAFRAAEVRTTDPYVTSDPTLVPLNDVLSECDLLLVGAPHDDYRGLVTEVPMVDIWGITETGFVP